MSRRIGGVCRSRNRRSKKKSALVHVSNGGIGKHLRSTRRRRQLWKAWKKEKMARKKEKKKRNKAGKKTVWIERRSARRSIASEPMLAAAATEVIEIDPGAWVVHEGNNREIKRKKKVRETKDNGGGDGGSPATTAAAEECRRLWLNNNGDGTPTVDVATSGTWLRRCTRSVWMLNGSQRRSSRNLNLGLLGPWRLWKE